MMNDTLEGQLREMYGRVAYTHKTHEKMADGYIARYKLIKRIEIALSAISSGSLVIAALGDSKAGTIAGALLSTVLLGLLLYFKEASLGEQAQKHTVTASKLWGVRERLLSVLVDLARGGSIDAAAAARDSMNEELEQIYRSAPRTDAKAYVAAQNALKHQEELFFSDSELDHLLPKQLRKTSRP
ncbi:SLATT domain-containing protein [Achromobacter piechaudii]|uniref:SMODS and SLOG-associating 2TM effector domain-containing protein n=1 Tax=Achromobacter piechaudii TaxID=72556 RepID=A0ABN7F6V7_9BURK|nr:SLATT domain-containing protein [Achromobacter piechaudii]CAB3738116.1 hypothetical protein LMG1873_05457 [Achromobacter piechaudii]CAB3921184.1 hypothetical protein LMG2828_05591 [Achromobacter piechaudii]CAB3958455.1 hypothetical protein LMG6103_05424 [Achromobacter piechaudii]